MNVAEEVNTADKKGGKKSTGWFTFGRKPRKWVPVEVSKPKNFQSMNHVEIDPNSELGTFLSSLLIFRIEGSS